MTKPPPLLVLGVRRSGTTLLRVMLDRHSQLAIPDESYFVPQIADRHRDPIDPAAFVDDLRRLPTIREWGVDPARVRARLGPRTSVGAGIAAVYEEYAAGRGKARWGDKTPMYMKHLHLLERLFPDALDLLQRLRARGVPLALVTNGDAGQQRDKIERYDLARFFDVIVVEGEFGAGKPDEVVYRAALDGLGVPPADAWMVGDHLEFDVAGPQRLGVQGVWLDREGAGVPAGSPVRPARIIRSLQELP